MLRIICIENPLKLKTPQPATETRNGQTRNFHNIPKKKKPPAEK